jgi:hypothetical protein
VQSVNEIGSVGVWIGAQMPCHVLLQPDWGKTARHGVEHATLSGHFKSPDAERKSATGASRQWC